MVRQFLCGILLLAMTHGVMAGTAEEIKSRAKQTLSLLRSEVEGGRTLLDKAKAVLVIPSVVPLTFGEGGEYGEGVLLVDEQPVAYYAVSGGNMGKRQHSAVRAQVLVFNELQALIDFRNTRAWSAQADSVHMASYQRRGKLSRSNASAPVVGFVMDAAGPRTELNIGGSVYRRIAR